MTARKSQRKMRRRLLCRGGGVEVAGNSTTGTSFGGRATGLPHLGHTCAPSGILAPHLAQPKMTFAVDEVELVVGILDGSPGLQKHKFQREIRRSYRDDNLP